ncbi:NAD-dependent succinate-semialdehyde dehydrogenase [Halalkalibacterium ligniniphilum]|uniref:NAD-dependent succinate-semialdehyde dehydrogenase n=2 Tax=Halalkalibacterium ligniniphilum TaxID=1134413 RepID=UPI000348B395|nr:NAD-dependent succinate-semialdehyde dehydrogenase [Halalkalibacterium ligniniphilum]
MKPYRIYIDGKWLETEEMIEVVNPATNVAFATVPKGGAEEAVAAVDAAHRAFPEWSQRPAHERSELLQNWFRLIDEHKQDIAEVMTREQGKPVAEALGEVQYANSFLSWYAEEAKRVYGETIPASSRSKRIQVLKQPVGVIAAITPWNFPAAMITRKVAPALAAGCTAVVKPAELTPLTALYLAKLAEEAGIPAGVLNIITGNPAEIGEVWMSDKRVRKLTFTGSTPVGKHLMRQAADTVKKLSLELGGHAPFIVMDDADIPKAVNGIIASKFRNAGQTCICANRIYVQEGVVDAFTKAFVAAVSKLKVGDGMTGTDIGPLINEAALQKVQTHVEDAVAKGAKLAYGGKLLTKDGGFYFEPTVVTNVQEDMICMQEETFGPLAPVATFTTEEEVIEKANDSPYGLAAYVFTENLGRAIRMSEALEYGIVGVNDGVPSTAQAPFGGFKESGLGREGSHYGIEEYLEVKYVSLSI